MKEFAIYTLARLGLFAASFAVIAGVLVLTTGKVSLLLALLLAAVVSAIGSYSLLRTQRERFAAVVDRRATAASARFEAARAKEDVD